MLKRLLKLKYIIIFFILIQLVLTGVISLYEVYDRENFLTNRTKLSQVEYETIYWKVKEQSAMIFQELINTQEIVDIFKYAYISDDNQKIVIRKKLHNKLFSSYNRLCSLLKLRQLHFHLPNNHSFLRMHRPDKFGDDLSGIRSTVEYVNKYKKPVDGFEEGRVYNGFRFVYPLFNENKLHIGSVEVSFSAFSFQNTLSNNLRLSQFIFLKKVVNEKVWKDEYKSNYLPSEISPLFVREANWKNDKFAPFKRKIQKNITAKNIEIFKQNIKSAKSYSMSLNIDNQTIVLSFLPIKNPVKNNLVGYFIFMSKTAYLNRLDFKNRLLKIISFAFLFSIFIIIYRKLKHDDEILEQKEILMEQSKMAQMGSMLSNIAHQWKQPLARINSKLIEVPISLSLTKEDKFILDSHIEDIENLTSYMANTIENFRTFFHPGKKQNYFNINDTIEKAISLLDLNNQKDRIALSLECNDNIRLYTYENELIQVLMVLLINAKDALNERTVNEPFIKIMVEDKISFIEISVIDNAGGIDKNILKQIFNPYFTTKNDRDSSRGIGLYMAKMIVESSMHGQLKYKKIDEESHFSIVLQRINRWRK